MRDRIRRAFSREVTMPRWALFLDFAYRCFILLGACVVIVLWWQAATRDEEADRNARIQSCTSGYAATYSAWDARTERRLAELVADSATTADPEPAALEDYERAATNADDVARLRIGLAEYAATSVENGNDFICPPLPDRLIVEGVTP